MSTLRATLGSWFAPLLIHNQNQQTAMMRAAAAKAQGLDPKVYGTPLPGSNIDTTVNYHGGGWLKGAILAVALLTGGGLGILGLLKCLSPAAPAICPTQQTITRQAWDGVWETLGDDGQWHEMKRERLK